MSDAVPEEVPSDQHCEQFLTLSTAARALGVPVSTLRRAVKSGELPGYYLGGVMRVRLSEIVRSIARYRI